MARDLEELLGKTTACVCGREHRVITRAYYVGFDAAHELIAQTGLTPKDHILLVADGNTFEAGGQTLAYALRDSGVTGDIVTFGKGELHADETTVGSILTAVKDETSLLIAVGSGTINDSVRYVAHRCGLPYCIFATAPSMDGYASNVAPLLIRGIKTTLPAVAPMGIFGDIDVLRQAPQNTLAAGFGDILGKYTAAQDWILAEKLLGEYRCPAIAELTGEAVQACMAAAPGLQSRDAFAVKGLMDSLVLSGIAMQMMGNSRPASGAEHHVSHFLEMRDMGRGRAATLHGDKVGMATLLVMRLYEKFSEGDLQVAPMQDAAEWAQGVERAYGAQGRDLAQRNAHLYRDEAENRRIIGALEKNWDTLAAQGRGMAALRQQGEAALRAVGGPVRPGELGYNRQDIVSALTYSKEIRERFTVMRLADITGQLVRLAQEVADEFC
ncbi:MAG: sn-glycerol-1-phosphate dehydrogenase [Eubacteriales bacterium]|nr:sn-glycerol-1-phosphate dehydrogenase [Eubacteriales bacterium]